MGEKSEKVDKKEHILQVAERLFAEHGFEGSSIRDIAAGADVNLAMISYYFGSKEKLFEELVFRRTAYMRMLLQELNAKESDPWVKLYTVIDLYVDKLLSSTTFHKIMYREISLEVREDLSTAICDILSGNAIQFANIIRDGIEKGVFKEVDVPLTVASIIGTINHSTLSKKLVSRVLGKDPATYDVKSEEHRTRLKKHLKNMITIYLKTGNGNIA